MKRICQTLKKPVFEVMKYPESELEWWAAFFSIDDNNDQPIIDRKCRRVTVEQSIADLERVLN